MLSPQHTTQPDAPINPARRRTRNPSRPTSRNQHRHERSNSALSMGRSFREGSANSQRRGSGSTEDREMGLVRKPQSAATARDPDGAVVDWTRNDMYRVSKLPALPAILKSFAAGDVPVIGSADAPKGYSLLLSHQSAYVWKYTDPHSIPHIFSFPLPKDEIQPVTAPFPLGSLVSASANSNEPGLVVVMPMTGRIAYWDHVGSAVAEGLFSKKRGVEGKIPIMVGESVTSVCSAEPAGFIVSLSSGRLCHVALRDLAGRPGVTVTIMRGHGGGVMGGLLGALSAGRSRRDVVAVRAGKVLRMGEREVVVCTARGNLSRWQVNRSGTYANMADVDLRDEMLSAIENTSKEVFQGRSRDNFVVVDAEVGNYQSSTSEAEDDVQIQVLGALMPTSEAQDTRYCLISVEVSGTGQAQVSSVHVVKSYTTPMEAGRARPRLYLPKPGKTSFVVFPRAVVIVSSKPNNEDLGMVIDRQTTDVVEDVVDFIGENNIEIIGSGAEDLLIDLPVRNDVLQSFQSIQSDGGHTKRARNPGVILIAKGAGVVRIEAFDLEQKKAPAGPVTVKSKIEQAVFYGVKEDNPLNFRGRKEIEYPLEEVEEAALQISKEILCSRSPYLPSVHPSLDAHLSLRASHLKALARHLRATFAPLSRFTMWQLLSDAEKCEAARVVWGARDARLAYNPAAGESVLENVINEFDLPDTGDNFDPVRHWFRHETDRMAEMLPLAKKSLVAQSNKGKRDQVAFVKADTEANEIIVGALMAAWRFREHSSTLYSLDGPEGIDTNGRLRNSAGLPPPWTSDTDTLQALGDQYEVSRVAIKTLYGPKINTDEERREIAEKLAQQLVDLAEVCCRAFEERADWCEQQGTTNEAALQEGISVRERYLASRSQWVKPLVDIGHIDKAYEIAEKWEDFRTLVEISSEELMRVEVAGHEAATTQKPVETIKEIQKEKAAVYGRIEEYFERFGENFAREMYEYLVENGRLQQLLNGFEGWREQYLTPFLRGNIKYAKLAWIHDVSLGELDRAAETLLTVANDIEEDLWNRKVELSIGKLAKLATINADPSSDAVKEASETYDVSLELIQIQETIFRAVKNIRATAVDIEAAVQIGIEDYGRSLKRKPGLRQLFKKALTDLLSSKVLGAEEIVDLLTLMESTDGGVLEGGEFYYALKAIALAALPKNRRESAERSVWRRCFLRDDWPSIVNTRNKPDGYVSDAIEHTALYTTIKLGYDHGLFFENSPFRPLSPEESLFSETAEELRARFPVADEEELTTLAHELLAENNKLRKFVQKAGLVSWWQGVLAAVGRREGEGEETMMEEGETMLEEGETMAEDSFVEDGDVEMA